MSNPMPTTQQTEAIIMLDGVGKRFGDFHALKACSMLVHKGQKIVLCGPSGSGKSTLIRCINRLEEHDSGRIVVAGTELTRNMPDVAAVQSEIGMVFQQFNLFPHLTVVENLMLAPRLVRKMPRTQAREIAMHYLARVRIPEPADKFPVQLSGGQQQRVAIARNGMTMVVVTHEMGFARRIADLVVFMDAGEIVEQAPPAAFFGGARNARTQAFLQQILTH